MPIAQAVVKVSGNLMSLASACSESGSDLWYHNLAYRFGGFSSKFSILKTSKLSCYTHPQILIGLKNAALPLPVWLGG